ncbi:MAG: hypothetical protein JSS96_07825 [Bacteroidetes bacterium]|nr:hypothetical protein [Bacteroidota bacterium]
MKLITTLALSLFGCASFAQSTQIGFETGTIAYYNLEYFSSGKPIILHKHWKQADFNNGLFIRRETKSHWAYQLSVNYYHDKHNDDIILPANIYSGIPAPEEFRYSLSQNIFNYSAVIQYRLNNNKALAKQKDKMLISYIGLSYTRLHSADEYSMYQVPQSPYYPVGYIKTKWNDDLMGLNYWGRYSINKQWALNLDVSYKISMRYTSQDYSYGSNDAVFTPFTTKRGEFYTYTKPTTYLTCMLGISYMFNK